MFKSIVVIFSTFLVIFNANAQNLHDDLGRLISSKKAQSIVVLSPAANDILMQLGASHLIVGYTDYANKPNLKAKNVGAFGSFNLEKVIALKPDLIIMPEFTYQHYGIKALQALHIRLFVFEPSNVGDILADIKKFGILTNTVSKANELINEANKNTKSLHKLVCKPTFAFLIWSSPPIVAGSDTFISNAIQLAGGKNIINKANWPEVSPEYLIEKHPDVLIVNSSLKSEFFKQSKLLEYFYKKNRVVFIKNNSIERPSMDIFKGIEFLNNYFYENSNNYCGR